MRVAIATTRPLPEPDPDEPLLLEALTAAGAKATVVPWDDVDADWSSFDRVVLRSTWDYHLRHDAFLDWLDQIAGVTHVHNPPDLVRWNIHKGYLLELAGREFPVVPTWLLERGSAPRLTDVMESTGWEEVVVKPAVSCASFETLRVNRDDVARGQAHLDRLLPARDMLVQPFLRSVLETGERALVWIDGELSHAIRKSPRFQGEDEHVEGPLPIEADEAEVANALMKAFAPSALYGRVDLTRDRAGQPQVMELELIEPSLFLLQRPEAATRLADAVVR